MSFATADQAAIYVLRMINPRSIIENFEFGGLIYRTSSGQFNYTIPRSGAGSLRACSGVPDHSNISLDGIQIPGGAVEVGCYHTHGDYSVNDAVLDSNGYVVCSTTRRARSISEVPMSSPSSLNVTTRFGDHFSDVDITVINDRARGVPGYRGYLGTPSGVICYYDPPNDRTQHCLCRHNRPVVRN